VDPPWQTTGNGHMLRCHIPLEELSRRAAESAVRVGSLSPEEGPRA
jgi:hypothetical protein